MNSPKIPSATNPQAPNSNRGQKNIWLYLLIGIAAGLVIIVGIMFLNLIRGNPATAGTATITPPSASTASNPTLFPTVAPPTVVVPTPAPQAPFGTANDYLNIRSGPGTEYPIYGVVAPGASSEIVGKSADNAWWAVKIPTSISPDGIGWAAASYVIVSGDPNVPVIPAPPPPQDINPSPPPSGSIVVQTIEPVNVRAGPGNEYPSYGKVPAGTPLEAQGISQDQLWAAVSIPTSIAPDGIGWVNTAYLQPFDPSSLPPMQP